jgi:ubiquinol-cytochrome c reductase cytochrome b subunit
MLIGVHLYLVARHGISEPPHPDEPVNPASYKERYERLLKREGIPFWPDTAWRDVSFSLAVGSIVLLLAIVAGPKVLGQHADPTIMHADPRPDWYFLW